MRNYWQYWRLETNEGRQRWCFEYIHQGEKIDVTDDAFWNSLEGKAVLTNMMQDFVFDKSKNPNSADEVYRSQKVTKTFQSSFSDDSTDAQKAFEKGVDFYIQLLSPDGHIPGDYGGPMFLLPGLIIVSYVTAQSLPIPHQYLIKQYLFNTQNVDGGWGLHIEGESTMYGTCLQYVALRLLGVDVNHSALLKAKKWIHKNGGATHIPSWGKFYLAVLGVYDWRGVNSLFPENWILPRWLPIHPGRYWCHARMVYLPMAYAYGQKITAPITPLIELLRTELYIENYDQIDWSKARNTCAPQDLFRVASPILKVMNFVTNTYEKVAIKSLRKKALNFIMDYIHDEDEKTDYINIGPVNQVINSLCVWHKYGNESRYFKRHVERWYDYLWVAEDGMKMQGYNGAQLWETAFAANAVLEHKSSSNYLPALKKMYGFIDSQQIKNGIDSKLSYFRNPNLGGWPFSTAAHGWPITDCTADGIKAAIKLNHKLALDFPESHTQSITQQRLEQAVDLVLDMQNIDGGWTSYEQRRAPKWIEVLNPSEVYGEIMVDYTYVECTSSVVQGLTEFYKAYPTYKTDRIQAAIEEGIQFIKKEQWADGAWYGSWGVCFTYAAWFALEALACVKEAYHHSDIVKKGCAFLVSKQRTDGGWGESYKSCVEMKYIEHESSQVIQTAWALLGLMAVGYDDMEVLKRGVEFLISRQESSGDFPQEGITGVFNKNCMETYTSYRNVFPIWAIGRYAKMMD